MQKKEKEFHRGQMALIMDIGSSRKVKGAVYSISSSEILVKANGEEVFFNKETLKGKTIFGPCVLMHIKA